MESKELACPRSVITSLFVPLALAILCGPLERPSQALECPGGCPEGIFDRGTQLLPPNGQDVPGGHTNTPGLCGTPSNGFVAVSTAYSNNFVVLQFNADTTGPEWDIWDPGHSWNSKPSCATTDPLPSSSSDQGGFVVVGAGSDYKLHAAAGKMAPIVPYPNVQQNPTEPANNDELIDSGNTYVNGVAASVLYTATTGVVVAIGLDSSNVLWSYAKKFPYLSNVWSTRHQIGALPANTTTYADLDINNGFNNNTARWDIFAHTYNNVTHQYAMYSKWIMTNTSGGITSTQNGWTQLTGTVAANPVDGNTSVAVTWDRTLGAETMFYVNGTQLVQTSSTTTKALGQLPLSSATPPNWSAPIWSGPAAACDPYDVGMYAVIARGSDGHIWVGEAMPETDLAP